MYNFIAFFAALKNIDEKIAQLKLKDIIIVELTNRVFKANIDQQTVEKRGELDGCYVVKTSVPKSILSTQLAHDRY